MNKVLHIARGDIAGGSMAKAGLPWEVFVWHDILVGDSGQALFPAAQHVASNQNHIPHHA